MKFFLGILFLFAAFESSASDYYLMDDQLNGSLVEILRGYNKVNPTKVVKVTLSADEDSFRIYSKDGSVAIECQTKNKWCRFNQILDNKNATENVGQILMDAFFAEPNSPWLSFTNDYLGKHVIFEKRHPVEWAYKTSIECHGNPANNQFGFQQANCHFNVIRNFSSAEAQDAFDKIKLLSVGSRLVALEKDKSYKIENFGLVEYLSERFVGWKHLNVSFRNTSTSIKVGDTDNIYLNYNWYLMNEKIEIWRANEFHTHILR
jgi:hypothetical protein